MAKAKKVEQEVVAKAEPSVADLMAMIQAQQAQMAMLMQTVSQVLPGNPGMSVPTGADRKVAQPVKEMPMASASLEAIWYPGGAWIAIAAKRHMGFPYGGSGKANGDGVILSFLNEKIPGYQEKTLAWKDKVPAKSASFSGQLPVGTVLYSHDGYGYDYHVVGERGTVQISQKEAIELATK
jgi:hypothetical protein